MKQFLILARGVSGSGKSTLAEYIKNRLAMVHKVHNVVHLESDMYFMKDGAYNFNPAKIGDAHLDTIEKLHSNLKNGASVIVSNTFTRAWEIDSYLADVPEDVEVIILNCEGLPWWKDTHNVPKEALNNQRARFQKNPKIKREGVVFMDVEVADFVFSVIEAINEIDRIILS